MNWKLSQDGHTASRTNADGSFESRLVSAIPTNELSTALPADIAPVATLTTAAIAKTYADIDAIYASTIGNRGDEYKLAESDALAFKAAGYSGACPITISSWKPTSALTNQQKADIIIAQSIALRGAVTTMRTQRFASQDAMNASTTPAQLDAAVVVWNAFIVATRTGLGL